MISMLITVAKRSKAVASTLGKRKHLTSIKTPELGCQVRITLIIDKIFNNIILFFLKYLCFFIDLYMLLLLFNILFWM
jgi:hypothetical protein